MVGGHEKQSDSNTSATSSSASASAVSADWEIAPPLQNVRVDTQNVGVIKEQKQVINKYYFMVAFCHLSIAPISFGVSYRIIWLHFLRKNHNS
jgi:hypothetical protein